MAKFDNAAFVKLVWKNERRIINPKTPKDIREGIDFFSGRLWRPFAKLEENT